MQNQKQHRPTPPPRPSTATGERSGLVEQIGWCCPWAYLGAFGASFRLIFTVSAAPRSALGSSDSTVATTALAFVRQPSVGPSMPQKVALAARDLLIANSRLPSTILRLLDVRRIVRALVPIAREGESTYSGIVGGLDEPVVRDTVAHLLTSPTRGRPTADRHRRPGEEAWCPCMSLAERLLAGHRLTDRQGVHF